MSYRCQPLDIALTVEELSLSGAVSLGRCSKSTAYRDVRRINDYLRANKYDWQVRLTIDKSNPLPYGLEQTRDDEKEFLVFVNEVKRGVIRVRVPRNELTPTEAGRSPELREAAIAKASDIIKEQPEKINWIKTDPIYPANAFPVVTKRRRSN